MNKIVIVFLLISVVGFSQEIKPIKSIAIPRLDSPQPDKKPEETTTAPLYSINKPFEPKLFKYPKKVYEEPTLPKSGIGNQPKSDLNVGKQYADKMNKSNILQKEGSDDSKIFRRHMDFGEFKTESETISLNYRDFGEIDADRIRVYVDGKVVAELLELDENLKKIHIALVVGVNLIEIEAINEGALSPNTGDFRFYDDQGKLITRDQWGLATGFKARFNFLRVAKGALNNKPK